MVIRSAPLQVGDDLIVIHVTDALGLPRTGAHDLERVALHEDVIQPAVGLGRRTAFCSRIGQMPGAAEVNGPAAWSGRRGEGIMAVIG